MLKSVFKKREYNIWQSFLIVFVCATLLLVMQTVMQNGTDYDVYTSQLGHIYVLVGNFVPVFMVMSILLLLTGSIAWACVPVGVVLNGLLVVNHYKVLFRDAPLKPADLTLGKEALNIVRNYDLDFCLRIVLCAVVLWLVSLFIICCVRVKKTSIIGRLCVALAFVVAFGFAHRFYYTNENIYNIANTDSDGYYEVKDWNYKGFVYAFVSNLSIDTYRYAAPDGYSDSEALSILADYDTPDMDADKMPNVIAIMSEAYFDIEAAEDAQFYEAPNPNFNALKKESQYGHIVVPGYAGDTASTEFEFLTGASLYLINRAKPSAYSTCVTKDVYGLPRMFKDLGYNTLAIHPGEPWFYNRHVAYPKMGFDKFISKDDLPKDTEIVNYYVSDRETTDLIIDNYKKHLEENSDKGYFNFTVTIQNHGPYSQYGTWRSPAYVRPDGMDEPLYNMINNYTHGHQDADALLGKVTDFLRTVDEPTVLVFFGDHLPHFDEDFKAYDYLGYNVNSDGAGLDAYHNRFLTPYIIWSNDAARKLIKENGGKVPVGDDGDISSNFLPVKLLKYMNVELPRYFAFTEDIMEQSEVIGSDYFVVNGKKLNFVSDEIYDEYARYRILQYYNLKRYKSN